jgi:GT2 family glycosyltransferase
MVDISIVIPFHRDVAILRRVLAPLRTRPSSIEVVIAVDGPSREDWESVAREFGAVGVQLPANGGPAAARNRGAAVAQGAVLVFVDGDVIAAPDAVERIRTVMRDRPDADAVFGAYDETPEAEGFVSQYRNLSHRYVHRTTSREALTFWAGLGAVRAHAFRAVGGFDESFTRPSIEDIELGYRLTAAGYRVLVEPAIEGKHLKRWTFASSVRSDLFDRGIPWTQLLLRVKSRQTDLNLTTGLRLSVVAAYLLILFSVLALLWPVAGIFAVGALAVLLTLNREYYRYFAAVRGWGFAARVVPLHFVHHLCNGVSFLTGAALFYAHRLFRWTLPGTLSLRSADQRPGGRATLGA